MKISKRLLLFSVITVLLVYLLTVYKLPYYIYKPGSADKLDMIVEVDGGYKSKGDMRLVTVSGLQATPLFYLWAKLASFHEIVPLEEVRPKELSDEEYMQIQLQMMESSQESSVRVAYEMANRDVDLIFDGVYVLSVLEGMPAEGKLKIGDRIISIDETDIKEADDLMEYIESKQAGDSIEIELIREEKTMFVDVELAALEDLDNKAGMGIQLVTNSSVVTDPEIQFSSGNIGGPSAGLVFALEIYDQLIEEDLTKGYQIVATGAIDVEGNVSRIGGVDKKVVAADHANADIFFAPYEGGASNSNYEVAKKTAEEIKTNMKVVPVDTFNEALEYLQELEEKAE